MKIGIDASRAFSKQRTGIEEYSFQVIKNLTKDLRDDQVVLYVRDYKSDKINLPLGWRIKKIKWPLFWTQVGLSLEMLWHPVDVLFVPAHVVPIIHPRNTVVTIHGLEYEFFPEGYSFWERLYMRLSIKASCKWAKKIVAVSKNTQEDLIKLYKVSRKKIEVIYEGYEDNFESNSNEKISKLYLLFIGRLEARKNIVGILKSFEILKEKYKIPHKLVLAGKFGYRADRIQHALRLSRYTKDIIQTGFVSEAKKRELFQNAEAFLFPSFYEGFGLPILEAQTMGVPVITSNISSMPEVAGGGALLVDPNSPEQIAEAVHKLISDKAMRDDIIRKGHENAQGFSWEKCSDAISALLKA